MTNDRFFYVFTEIGVPMSVSRRDFLEFLSDLFERYEIKIDCNEDDLSCTKKFYYVKKEGSNYRLFAEEFIHHD